SINFPFDLRDYAIVTIGAVDINGKPVFMKKNRDVERLISIKSAFNAKKFKKAYELATEAQELHPDSIFASDFLRYRIKSLAEDDMKENAEEIIKLGKYFIKRYTSDEYLPEVLLILARVYSATGFESDANYFFDRLIQEHKGSRFADLGLIYLGDQLFINGKSKEAIKRYLEAYYGTKDIDIASLAAYKLALRYFDMGKEEEGVEYIRKIWEKNPKFLLKDVDDAHDIAKRLASHKYYDLAIEIDRALLNRLKKLDDLYEKILFEIGEWYDEKGDLKKAVEWYERYLEEFSYGEFSDKAKESLDALFVINVDTNATKALKRFDNLMREYRGEPIAQKALLAKAKLLFDRGRYKEVLNLADSIEKIEDEKLKEEGRETLRSAAEALFESSAKEGECKMAIMLIKKYALKPKQHYDDFLYNCYEKYAKYEDALNIAKKRLNGSKLSEREKWLCRAVHSLTLSGRYEEAKRAAEDLSALSNDTSKICPAYEWDLVKALHHTGPYEKEIALIKKMSERHGDDIGMAEIYRGGYDSAKKEGDHLQQLWMLKKILKLQKTKGVHPYSPWVEFELIRLYKSDNKRKDALEVAKSMKALGLKGKSRARWLYELGSLQLLAGNKSEAKESFKECAQQKDGGEWSKLCKDALSLE
ncbi:MAG: hypothetical protein L3J42_07095, partial [Hydrogenimonas sp.]|nr:hypothetical protein [Hydrogenimonas sp.]